MIVLQVNFDLDPAIIDPEDLLARYSTLTGWSDALMEAGAQRVVVLQRFRRDATIARKGVEYAFWRTWWRARQTIRRVIPDVAHVNGLRFPVETATLRALLPQTTALVVQDHASGAPRPANRFSPRRFLQRRAMRVVDGLLFTSVEQAEPWRAARVITPEQPVHAVPEASTAFRPISRQAAREMSRLEGAPALLWVGRLNANKDPLTVLDAFEEAIARLPGAILSMVFGEDDMLPSVRSRVDGSATLARHVHLVGRVPHHMMAAYYSAADLFVLGSHHEGSGYALIEALACGLVPVVTDIPPFRAITAGGRLGPLWPPGDPSACAQALVETAQQDLAPLRARVADHFKRRLSWPAVGHQALAAYADVIALRRSRT